MHEAGRLEQALDASGFRDLAESELTELRLALQSRNASVRFRTMNRFFESGFSDVVLSSASTQSTPLTFAFCSSTLSVEGRLERALSGELFGG